MKLNKIVNLKGFIVRLNLFNKIYYLEKTTNFFTRRIMMKKYISIMVVMMFILTSCSQKPATTSLTSQSTSSKSTNSGEDSDTKSTNSGEDNDTKTNKGTTEDDSSSANNSTIFKPGNSSTQIDRVEVKKLLEKNSTFAELKDKYNLQKVERFVFLHNFSASIGNLPVVTFAFSDPLNNPNSDSVPNPNPNPEQFTFDVIFAPASMLFPEYVDKHIDQISIINEPSSINIFFMKDSFGNYTVPGPSKPGILSADDIVYMTVK